MASNGDSADDYVEYQTVVQCDGCGGMVNATSYSINCPGNLCDTCKANHPNRNLTLNYRVLPLGHSAAVKAGRSISLSCKLHSEQEYTTYCTKCKVPCCAECLTNEHRGHTFSELQDVGDEARQELGCFITKLETELLPAAKEVQTTIRKMTEQDQAKLQDGRNEIEHISIDLTKEINRLKEEALEDLQQHYSPRNTVLDTCRKKTDDSVAGIDTRIKELKTRLKECSNLEAEHLRAKFPNLSTVNLPELPIFHSFEFQRASFKFPSFSEVIGKVVLQKENGSDTDDLHKSSDVIYTSNDKQEEESADNIQRQDDNEHTVQNVAPVSLTSRHIMILDLAKIRSYRTDLPPYVMALPQSEEVWISSDKQLQRYGNNGMKLNQLKFKFNIFEVALSASSHEIFASDHYDKRIMRISGEGDATPVVNTRPLPPRGICINDRHQLVVGLGYQKPPIKLAVYDVNTAKMVQEIERDEAEENIFLHDIYRLTQNGNGDYIVADTNRWFNREHLGRVVCVSREGRKRWVYKVNGVSGVACDRYNSVIVCNRDKGKILLIDGERTMVRKLMTKEDCITCPLSIAVNDNDILYIGHYGNSRGGVIEEARYLQST